MPEIGQPGGGSRGRSSASQGGQMAAGNKGPFIKVLYIQSTPGNVVRRVKCPIGVRWNLISAYIYLDTDATVADRVPKIDIMDADGLDLCWVFSGTLTAANLTAYDDIGPSESCVASLYFPYPLVDGMAMNFRIQSGQAGDAWYARVVVMEWKL